MLRKNLLAERVEVFHHSTASVTFCLSPWCDIIGQIQGLCDLFLKVSPWPWPWSQSQSPDLSSLPFLQPPHISLQAPAYLATVSGLPPSAPAYPLQLTSYAKSILFWIWSFSDSSSIANASLQPKCQVLCTLHVRASSVKVVEQVGLAHKWRKVH